MQVRVISTNTAHLPILKKYIFTVEENESIVYRELFEKNAS